MLSIASTSNCGLKKSLYGLYGTSKACSRVVRPVAFQEEANMDQSIPSMTMAATAAAGTDLQIARAVVLTDLLIKVVNLMGRLYLA